jgi:hypothetical protein
VATQTLALLDERLTRNEDATQRLDDKLSGLLGGQGGPGGGGGGGVQVTAVALEGEYDAHFSDQREV